jgi:MoaA/NifB/PqqE/SkfB family radical SAM enzyme
MKKIKQITGSIFSGIQQGVWDVLRISAQFSPAALRIIRRDDLELRVDKKNRIRLYFKDLELTNSAGFNGAVFSGGIWHSLSEAFLKINRITQYKLGLFIKFRNIPLVQHWVIELGPDNQINWNIEMEAQKPLRIEAVKANVFFSKYYRIWFNAQAQESRFPHFTNDHKACYETRQLDFVGLKSGDQQMPPFIFKADGVSFALTIQNTDIEHSSRVLEIQFEEEKELYQPGVYPYFKASFQVYPDVTVLEGILLKIRQEAERKRLEAEEQRRQAEERKRQEEEARRKEKQEILEQIHRRQEQLLIQVQEYERLRQQQEEMVAQDIRLIQQHREDALEQIRQAQAQMLFQHKEAEERKRQEEEESKQAEERKRQHQEEAQRMRTFKNGLFMLYLDWHNRFHIHYKDTEITKGEGLSVGTFSEGAWYNSSDSQTKVERPSSDEMLIYFNHNRIPVVQIWHLRFTTQGVMDWEVRISIKEPLRIDRRNASLFLSKVYKGWILSPKEGQFPSDFGVEWQMMHSSSVNKLDFMGLYSGIENFPVVALKSLEGLNTALTIQNTDIEHSSRVLEIQFEEEKELYQPGVYPYFKASFQVYPDVTVLEGILLKIRQEAERKKQEEEQGRQAEERKRLENEEQKKLAEENKQLELERKRLEAEEQRRQAEERKRQEEEQRRRAEELKRQEEEQRRRAEERKRQVGEWEKHEEILRSLQEKIKKVYLEPNQATELVVLKEGYMKNDNSLYLHGDTEDLNDKISLAQGDFKKNVSKIKLVGNTHKKIKIGISRFNFFKLNEIAQFCSSLMNQRLDLLSVILNPLPLKRLYLNFFDYLKELNKRVETSRIEFFLKDEKLLDLLYSISHQANQYNERELLRLLGVISEHAFIGPQTIVLDTFHRCNTNCIHCWIHTPRRAPSHKFANLRMDLSLYKNIIDNAADLLCDEIIIQGDGEPLLDNRFLEMVQYARNKGLKVIFFTNAILLDENKARKIIELEIDEIYCSLPAGTAKTYTLINSKQSQETFHKISQNLKNLILLRRQLKKSKPALQMTHVIHDLNHHELEEMARLDARIGADKARFYLARLDKNIKFLKIKPAHIKVIEASLKKVAVYLKQEHIDLQDNIWFQLKNYNSKTAHWSKDKFLKSGCPVGWFFCLILARGELSMCCHMRLVGSLGEKSFRQVWNSVAYDKFRSQAKYIMQNKNVTFANGVKLYDEYCNNCDTHQVILRVHELLKKYNLEKFYKGSIR